MKIISKYFLIILIVFLAGFTVYWSPSYLYRVFAWQDADYDDYKRFRLSEIKKDTQTFQFTSGTKSQELAVRSDFEEHELINNIDSFLVKEQTYAFIVIRNDSILFEKYYNDNQRKSIQTSFSTTKSILSLLVGMAINDKNIKSIDDPVTNYIPELLDRDIEFKNITIEDLLRMRSGIKYKSGIKFPIVNCDDPLTYSHPDLRMVAIRKSKIDAELNNKFHYNNYNPLLLGIILERTLDKSVSSLFEQNIWKIIGSEFDASWITDNNKFELMHSGINASAIDFAKVGRLVLNNGSWNGNQIINSSWIESSTIPKDTLVFNSGQKWGYSYLWWSVIKEDKNPDIFACGRFGQFIYISPKSNVIIIRHGLKPNEIDDDDWTDIFSSFASK